MNCLSTTDHSCFSDLLEDSITDLAPRNFPRLFAPLDGYGEDLQDGGFTVHSSFNCFGEEVRNCCSDGINEAVDNGGDMDRDDGRG